MSWIKCATKTELVQTLRLMQIVYPITRGEHRGGWKCRHRTRPTIPELENVDTNPLVKEVGITKLKSAIDLEANAIKVPPDMAAEIEESKELNPIEKTALETKLTSAVFDLDAKVIVSKEEL